jgi:putative nucleotidyltransferase with HDIG domain
MVNLGVPSAAPARLAAGPSEPLPSGTVAAILDAAAEKAAARNVAAGDSAPATQRLVPYYAALLALLAVGLAVLSDFGPVADDPWLLVGLVGLFIALDLVRLDLFERANTSPASLPVLAIAALFGLPGVLIAEATIVLVRIVQRTPPVKFIFDFGALALAGAAAALTFEAIPAEGLALVATGVAAGLAYYAVNMPLLAIVIGLNGGTSPLENFREQMAWLVPHYAAFGALGALLALAGERMGVTAVAVFGIPAAALWLAEKQYLERSRAGVAELRRSHAELTTVNEQLRALLDDNERLLSRIHQSYLSTITSLARTIEAKDPYTGGHTERVADISASIATELGLAGEELRAVQVGAVIHDIGKIGVPDAILLKPGPLTAAERDEMERHVEISSYIVAELELPEIVKRMVRGHHERFDGTGYPDSLAGEEIPLAARVLSVADALDAMTTDRSYRRAIPLATALEVLADNAGSQFCPRVVQALTRVLARDSALVHDLSSRATPDSAQGTDTAASAAGSA